MTTVAMIPGAGGSAWYLHPVVDLLRGRGIDAFAVDLPAADPAKGLSDYADVVVEAIGARDDVVLVAQSLGGFTAPLVWPRVDLRAVVFLTAMVPSPGERLGDWSEHVGAEAERQAAAERGGWSSAFDDTTFFHDVPAELVEQAAAHDESEAATVFDEAVDFAWPDVPVHVVAARDDRMFPLDLQRRVARERLGVEPEIVPGGHLATLSSPGPIADLLARWAA